MPVLTDTAIRGSIVPAGDRDFFRVVVSQQASVRFETFVPDRPQCQLMPFPSGWGDTVLRLFNAAGQQIGVDDDSGVDVCSLLVERLPPGTYFISVEGHMKGAPETITHILAYTLEIDFTPDDDDKKDDDKKDDDKKDDDTPAQGVLGEQAPLVLNLWLDPSRFFAAPRGLSIAQSRTGTRVSYRLSEPARVRFTVERPMAGRRLGGRCVALRRSDRGRGNCTRYVLLPGSFSHSGGTGLNAFRFTGRLFGRTLSPGPYRLVGVPTDAASNIGAARRAGFGVIRAQRPRPPRPPRFTG